jgi:hypothetical protein
VEKDHIDVVDFSGSIVKQIHVRANGSVRSGAQRAPGPVIPFSSQQPHPYG